MKKLFRHILAPFYALARKLFGGKGLRRYPAIDAIYKALVPYARNDYAEVNGYKLHLDALEGIDVADGGFEAATTEFLKQTIKEGQTVVDIGADIGYYTFLAGLNVGERGKVFAFEPNPVTFAILEKNLHLNGFGNVTLVPQATGDRPDKMPFYEHGPHSSLGYDRFGDGKPTRMVPVLRLDDYFPNDAHIDILKIDIEGSEPRAFQGMPRILATPGLTLVFEFYPRLMRMAGHDPRNHLEILAAHGFVFYDLGVEGMTRPVTIETLLTRYPETTEQMTNLVGKK